MMSRKDLPISCVPTASRQAQIPEQVDRYDRAVGHLCNVIDALYSRLEPFMSCAKSDVENIKGDGSAMLAPAALTLYQHNTRLEGQINKIEEILNRLEV